MQFAHRVQEMFKTLASTSEIFGKFPGFFWQEGFINLSWRLHDRSQHKNPERS